MSKGRIKQDLEQRDQVYSAAVRYLARREYAPEELRRRLLRRGAAADAVEETISRLQAAGWLSEERFAASRVRQRRDLTGRGRAAIRAELRALGVDEAVSQAALDEEYSEEQEAALVNSLARRALAEVSSIEDRERRNRLVRSAQRRLLARGFAPRLVLAATEEYLSQDSDDEQ